MTSPGILYDEVHGKPKDEKTRKPVPRKRIFYRILVPFSLLFAAATFLSWLVSIYFITKFLDLNLDRQADRVARIISQSAFVLNPVVLPQLTNLLNSKIVVYDSNGRVLNTTLSPDELSVSALEEVFRFRLQHAPGKEILTGSIPYHVAVQQLGTQPDPLFVSVWTPLLEYGRLKTRIALGTGIIALSVILCLALVNWLVTRTITGPVENLTRLTTMVSEGDLGQRAEIRGGDEIATLAGSFNQMIEKLVQYEKKLVESEKLAIAGQMAAGMAHEIRNPLTSIKMLGQLMHSRLTGRKNNAEILQAMVSEIDRLDRIIQEMVDRTRPKEFLYELGEINSQIEEVLSFLNESLTGRQIAVDRDFAPDLPKAVFDREKIKQVLWNLLLNAKEAMPAGGRLSISTGRAAEDFIQVLVEDTGTGLGEVSIEKCFDPFYTTKPEGMGMGLTISRKIVEQHGGRLSLEVRPEGGARARVLLPVAGPQPQRSSE